MKPDNNPSKRVALITGAARRIGAAIVAHLHEQGFCVVIHCHQSKKEASSLARELNQKRADSVLVLTADLTIEQKTAQLIEDTIQWGGQLDLLVNNAAVFSQTTLNAFDHKAWDALFTINVKAPFWLSLAAYPFLALKNGSIINITDIHADSPLKGYSVYCQSKAALSMQTKSLAREFAPKVRVNAIAPGSIDWPEHANALSLEQQQQIIMKTPLKRHGHPKFIAQALLGIVDNPFITGQTLRVDGGRGLT